MVILNGTRSRGAGKEREYKVAQHIFGAKAVESCEIMIHPLHLGDLWRFMGAKWLRLTNATNSLVKLAPQSGGFNQILSSIPSK